MEEGRNIFRGAKKGKGKNQGVKFSNNVNLTKNSTPNDGFEQTSTLGSTFFIPVTVVNSELRGCENFL